MVLQKKLYYGFNGYQAPVIPRGLRSARAKRFVKKKVDENKLSPFELLAAVAGKLLLEKESAAVSDSNVSESKSPIVKTFVKQEQPDELKTFKVEPCDQGSCDEGTVTYEVCCQRPSSKFNLRECSQASSSVILDPASVIVESDQSGKAGYHKQVTSDKSKSGITVECFAERHSSFYAESNITKSVDRSPLQTELTETKNQTDESVTDLLCCEDPMEFDSKPPILASSDSSIEPPHYENCFPRSSSFPRHRGHMEPFKKDDDENFSRCTQPRTSKFSKSQRVGDRRIRKMLASKFWKVGPTLLKDVRFSNNGTDAKSFRSRKMCYTRQRTQKNSFKRKRLFEHSSMSISCGEFSCEAISKFSEMNVKGEECDAATSSHEENGFTSSVRRPLSTFNSEEYQVKLNIKTIKLPELFIEMPESETVGALKRTVMEAVTAILRNGLRVGVVLQGKKIPDDTKTLRQAGICHGAKLDSLGFTLEKIQDNTTPLARNEYSHFLGACGSSEPLSWLPPVPTGNSMTDTVPDNAMTTVAGNETKNGFIYNSSDMSLADNTTKALVVVPPVDTEVLAIVPLHRKSRRPAIVQRRIRRPFSVAEVEALVQAVENIGTGRWRDVKLRAFENAKHRTYVDLKDKWKTLVHTARISPQQRRGDPVPQELLNRVLAAHGYWSQQQAKLQNKQQQQQPERLMAA